MQTKAKKSKAPAPAVTVPFGQGRVTTDVNISAEETEFVLNVATVPLGTIEDKDARAKAQVPVCRIQFPNSTAGLQGINYMLSHIQQLKADFVTTQIIPRLRIGTKIKYKGKVRTIEALSKTEIRTAETSFEVSHRIDILTDDFEILDQTSEQVGEG